MFGHLACANSIERNPARVNLSPTMGTTSRVRLRGIKFTVLLRVKSVNETFIQSSRLNIIKIEIPKLKGGKKSSESALDESRIFGEKMKNSIRQLTFLFYTFHLSPRVLLSRIRPAKIKRIPSKSFLLSFPPIEFPSLDRRSTLAFLKFATASFDLFAAQPQFLPTRFSHRIDGIDGGSENWLNEVEGGGARRIDACASIWAEWARSTRLEREERERGRGCNPRQLGQSVTSRHRVC